MMSNWYINSIFYLSATLNQSILQVVLMQAMFVISVVNQDILWQLVQTKGLVVIAVLCKVFLIVINMCHRNILN